MGFMNHIKRLATNVWYNITHPSRIGAHLGEILADLTMMFILYFVFKYNGMFSDVTSVSGQITLTVLFVLVLSSLTKYAEVVFVTCYWLIKLIYKKVKEL